MSHGPPQFSVSLVVVLALACQICAPSALQATDFSWDNFSGDSNWNTRINWDPYPDPPNVPGLGDTAVFDGLLVGAGVGNNAVNVSDGTAIDVMKVIDTATVDLTIGDGTTGSRFDLGALNSLVVGDSFGDTATLNLLGGWFDTFGTTVGGRATFNIINPGSYWDSLDVLVSGDTIANTAGIGLGLGAQITTNGNLDVGSDTGSGRVVVDGTTVGFEPASLWTITGSVDIGPTGTTGSTFGQVTLQDGGRMSVESNLDVQGNFNGFGKITVQTGGDLDVGGALTVGLNGELELFDAASQITAGSFIVVFNGLFTHEDGTLTVDGGTFNPGTTLYTIDGADPTDKPVVRLAGGATASLSGSATTIGDYHRGRLEILSGSHVDHDSWLLIGSQSGSNGEVIVDGQGSKLTTNWGLRIGIDGSGVLRVLNGGSVYDTASPGESIGSSGGSEGVVEVSGTDSDGTPSTYTTNGQLEVGWFGHGTLEISAGGLVNAQAGAVIAAYAGSDGSSATVSDTGSRWAISGALYVGGDDTSAGANGTLTVKNGGLVSVTGTLKVWNTGTVELLGSEITAGSFIVQSGGTFNHEDGTLTVDGGTFDPGVSDYKLDGADATDLPVVQLTNGATGYLAGTAPIVGEDFRGRLEILSGSRVVLPELASILYIGLREGSDGEVKVDGQGSQLRTDEGLIVGYLGRGVLRILNGGSVYDLASPGEPIGTGDGSVGIVQVSGTDPGGVPSTYTTNGLVQVGAGGHGTLEISGGGLVDARAGAAIAVVPGSGGSSALVTDSGSHWNITGGLYVGGSDTSAGGTGKLTVKNGGLVTAGSVKVWQPGTIELNSGIISTSTVELAGGTLQGTGAVQVVGELANTNGIVSPGVSPGAIAVFDGNYMQDVNGTLRIEIGGTDWAQYDHLDVVSGSATLAGRLEVSLIDPTGGTNVFMPQAGNSFEFLTAAGGVGGMFTTKLLPPLAGGLFFDVLYSGNAATLAVQGVLGDYNRNGAVDAPDYFVWRSELGQTAVGLAADGDLDGGVDGDDFDVWETNLDPGSTIQVLFSEDFYGAVPGTYGVGQIPGTQFQVGEANVDVVGVRNGSFFSCDRVASGNCLDLVGDSAAGVITSVPTFDLTARTTYFVDVGVDLQGFADTDPAQSEFSVALGSLAQTLIAIPAGEDYRLAFTPLTDEAGARLTFTTNDAPDFVHGAVLDHIVLFTTYLLGDYNRNGTVDAADYVVWRNTLGQSGAGLAADGNGNGQVDPGDYDVWRTHFGQTAGSGSAFDLSRQTAAPEPASIALVLLAVLGLASRGRPRIRHATAPDNWLREKATRAVVSVAEDWTP